MYIKLRSYQSIVMVYTEHRALWSLLRSLEVLLLLPLQLAQARGAEDRQRQRHVQDGPLQLL